MSWGKIHDYLGMTLYFSKTSKVQIWMDKYTQHILDAFPDDVKTPAAKPASDHLFEVQHDNIGKPLPETQARLFHQFAV